VKYVLYTLLPQWERYFRIDGEDRKVNTIWDAGVYTLQVHPGDLNPTSAPRDPDVNTNKEKVECNGAISALNKGAHDERCSLRRKVDTLNVELAQSRQLVANLQQTEQSLRQRSKTLLRF